MATQTTILNERAKLLKLRVCQLLGWTEMEYAEFQFACGKQYLQHYIPRDPEGIDELVTSKLYWNWWKLMWTNRDWAYLDENENDLQALHQSNREKLYKHLHDPHALSQLRESCSFYIHGHSVGGTNPSLVEMLFYDCTLVCYDVLFNRKTAGDCASYFNSAGSLAVVLKNPGKVDAVMRRSFREKYTSILISSQYINVAKLA